jgi:uncharacterized protein (DUF2147 family)
MRHRLAAALWATSAAFAQAEPVVSQQGAADANDVTGYWVKCDNGNVVVTHCQHDQQHCGERHDQSLPREAIAACEGIAAFTLFKGK